MGPAVYLLLNVEPEHTDDLIKAETIILSKPDLYDVAGGLRSFIKKENYDLYKQLPSFWIFRSNTFPR